MLTVRSPPSTLTESLSEATAMTRRVSLCLTMMLLVLALFGGRARMQGGPVGSEPYVFTDLGLPGPGVGPIRASAAINGWGGIVGTYSDGTNLHGFFWLNGQFQDIA